VRNTEALSRLAKRFEDSDVQEQLWDRIGGFTQDVQQQIIRVDDDDLNDLARIIHE